MWSSIYGGFKKRKFQKFQEKKKDRHEPLGGD